MGSVLQQRSVDDDLVVMDSGFVLSCKSGDTSRCETKYAVIALAILIREIVKVGVERYENKVIELLYCSNIELNTVRDKLESMKSCSELFRESTNLMPEKRVFLKEVRIEKMNKAGKSVLKQKRVIEVVKGKMKICTKERKMRCRAWKKEKEGYPMRTSFLNRPIDRDHWRELQPSTDHIS